MTNSGDGDGQPPIDDDDGLKDLEEKICQMLNEGKDQDRGSGTFFSQMADVLILAHNSYASAVEALYALSQLPSRVDARDKILALGKAMEPLNKSLVIMAEECEKKDAFFRSWNKLKKK